MSRDFVSIDSPVESSGDCKPSINSGCPVVSKDKVEDKVIPCCPTVTKVKNKE